MSDKVPYDLAEKAEAMREFRQARDSGLPCAYRGPGRDTCWANERRLYHRPRAGRADSSSSPWPDQSGGPPNTPRLGGPQMVYFWFFHRSAHWCQYCRSQLVELEQSRTMLEKNGVHIAAISFDSQEILAAFAREYSIRFPLLSDKGSVVIRKFGIFNQNVAPDLKRNYWIPHPVEYLVASGRNRGQKVLRTELPASSSRVRCRTAGDRNG